MVSEMLAGEETGRPPAAGAPARIQSIGVVGARSAFRAYSSMSTRRVRSKLVLDFPEYPWALRRTV